MFFLHHFPLVIYLGVRECFFVHPFFWGSWPVTREGDVPGYKHVRRQSGVTPFGVW